ncbi:MAG: 2-amino-4-hydroxy-6-hydroxymethyldihydropteridine diphosphokinase [Candidatus Hydrogenedentota bacterium]
METSPFVETVPLDRHGAVATSSPPYLNTVVSGRCDLSPRDLFKKLLAVETDMGRKPHEKSRYLPRVIDIDILYLSDEDRPIVIQDDDLVVPHPRLKNRPFFLEPLATWGIGEPL